MPENIDYEKLYKQVLAKAKDLHDNHGLGQPQVWTVCEELFPELKNN